MVGMNNVDLEISTAGIRKFRMDIRNAEVGISVLEWLYEGSRGY